MLIAQDRNSVMSWTERQLGEAAGRVAVIEISDEIAPKWFGKLGTTGGQARCEAFISVTPDSIQRVADAKTAEFEGLCKFLAYNWEIQKSSVH